MKRRRVRRLPHSFRVRSLNARRRWAARSTLNRARTTELSSVLKSPSNRRRTMSAHSPIAISVLLIDDHPIFRAGLRILIESHTGMKIVGEADQGAEALLAVRREQPNIILLDLDLSGVISLDLIPDLLAASQTSRIL